jgi:hypothetical protein
LRHRCRCRERDVDSAGDQHHEQPERENAHERIGRQQVKKILHRQELAVRDPEVDADHKDDDEQPKLVAAPKPAQ